jgi:hypothetical protein
LFPRFGEPLTLVEVQDIGYKTLMGVLSSSKNHDDIVLKNPVIQTHETLYSVTFQDYARKYDYSVIVHKNGCSEVTGGFY